MNKNLCLKAGSVLCTFLAIITCALTSQAQMRITEYMYNSTAASGPEFIEFTNVGNTAIDMTGWRFCDADRLNVPASIISLSGFGTVQPGEAVILTDVAAATFRTKFAICNNVKVIGGNTTNLGRNDEINLYDNSASTTPIDRLTYNDQGTGTVKGPRTSGVSAYPTAAVLGANNASQWVLSVSGNAEGAHLSSDNDIASPGKSNVNAITTAYVPCPSPGTLTLTLNTTATSNFIDGGITTSPTSISFSGVVNDPSDPGAVSGITLAVKDNNVGILATDYTLTGASNSSSVVPNANIQITKSDGSALVKITAAGAGYATITLTLTKGANTQTFLISYAASAAATTPAQTIFHTGYSDGSAAVALDDDYMVIADDEKNMLNVYSRSQSGLPVKSFDYSAISDLSLTDLSGGVPREIDIEAVAKSLSPTTPNRSYWMGSLSNQSSTGSAFNDRPNRNRIFAVDISGTGASTAFSYVGSYKNLKNNLFTWGNTYGLGLSASATPGNDPKLIDGFNIEGMAFGPDNTTMYIGFRAPLEPTTNRVNALIAPVQNFETWFGNGTTAAPTFGAPILLDLGGRGIRDIGRLSNSLFVILAGDYDDAGAISSVIYRWNGNAADAPVLYSGFNVTSLNPEGVLPVFSGGVMSNNKLEIISDNGAVKFYGDGVDAKDLTTDSYKKFRSDFVTSATPLPVIFEDFKAAYIGNGTVALHWKTAPNNNISQFMLERSADGKSFEPIANIAASNEQMTYSFADNVCCSPAFFYRIKELMNDGSVYFTNIQMVNLPPTDRGNIAIGYDAASGFLNVVTADEAVKQLQISDVSGKVVLRQNISGALSKVSLNNLAQGVFVVEVRSGNNVKRTRIIH